MSVLHHITQNVCFLWQYDPDKKSLDVSNDHMVKNKSGFYASLGPRFWENNPISPLLTYFLAPLLSGYSVQWKISRKGINFFGEWLLCYIVVDHCYLTLRMSITVSDDNGVVFHRQNNTNLYWSPGCDAIYPRGIDCLHTRARQHQGLFTEPLCFNPVKLLGLKRWGSSPLE